MIRKLPLDISTFSELRLSNYVYVDKTEYMYRMITGGRRFFLSRPRRFGKSLLVSTLKEILSGNKDLFNGLWITKSDYQWKEYGVINLDLSGVAGGNAEQLKNGLQQLLIEIANEYKLNIDLKLAEPGLMLRSLIKGLRAHFDSVAILVDEYDSPILRALKNPIQAEEIRSTIQQFFTTIKSLDADINFVFITGVSSFARAGLFSGINNLTILTLDERYAAICGYTDEEVDLHFKDHITTWAQKKDVPYDQVREQIKAWYNGYRFSENEISVYNPFSLMHALDIQKFKNFWFQSGTPTFLVEVLKKEYKNFNPEKLEISEDSLGIFDIGTTPLLTLMFQAGYLTITGYNSERRRYILGYPNQEVRDSLQIYLFEVFAHVDHNTAEHATNAFYNALESGEIKQIIFTLKQLFVHVPYQLHIPEEKFYHALFQMACTATRIKAQSEYSISHGRIDLVLDLPKFLYVIEIKFNKPAQEALAQIEERRYYERFLDQKKPIILLGLSFERAPSHFDISYTMRQIDPNN